MRGGESESAIGNWVRPTERPPNAEAMRRKSSTPFSSSTTNSEATTYYFSISIFFKVMILFLNKNRFFSVRFITLSIINIFDQLESIIIFTLL